MTSGTAPGRRVPGAVAPLPEGARRSHALAHFDAYLTDQPGLHILDLGGLNQNNLDYLTGLNHRVYAEDVLRGCDTFFSEEERTRDEIDPAKLEVFLNESLNFPDQSTNGALVWDRLQFLPPPVTRALIARLHRVLAPDALVLAFFHPETVGPLAHPQSCRILDRGSMILKPKEPARPVHRFNARSIEKLFHGFREVKFFMTRESVQEVVVRR
jgi:hypothetical protein